MNPPVKVLIVDDHQIMRDTLRAILDRTPNINVVGSAENGMEAFDKVKLIPVDLVLMDISMPFMDGIQATKLIIESYPNIKILAVTMHDELALLSETLTAGSSGFLVKPVGKKQLMEAITSVMEGKYYLGFYTAMEKFISDGQ